MRAKGKDGPVDLKVKLAGYNQAVLDLHGITDAVRYDYEISSTILKIGSTEFELCRGLRCELDA